MQKQFIKDCKSFLEKIHIKNKMKNEEQILWIYWNLFFYLQLGNNEKGYRKEHCIQGLEALGEWRCLLEEYKEIPADCYDELKESILIPYGTKLQLTGTTTVIPTKQKAMLTLKDLEEVYEYFMQEELRIKTGAYYTPELVVAHMVWRTIVPYIERKIYNGEKVLESYLQNKGNGLSILQALDVLEKIEVLRIMDLSCGGGVFLRHSLDLLFTIEAKLHETLGMDYSPFMIKKKIIENNIFGADIQSNTIQLCKLLLLFELTLTEDAQGIATIQWNIHQENGLQLDKANYFDVVIGNPPYIGERGNKDLFDEVRRTPFGEKYYECKMDYFYFFIYKGHEVLKEDGLVSYITTNYFVTADGGKKLRQFMKDSFTLEWIVNFNGVNIFKNAKGQHNMIMVAQKGKKKDRFGEVCFFHKGKIDFHQIQEVLAGESYETVETFTVRDQDQFYDSQGHLIIQSQAGRGSVFEKIEKRANHVLGDLCAVNQGIVSGADRLTLRGLERLNEPREIGEGIFVLGEEELKTKGLDGEVYQKYVREFYKNSHIKKYYTLKNQGLYLLYIDDHNLEDIQELSELYRHLIPYQSLLEERREVQRGTRKWYALQWPRDRSIFESPKILAPQRAYENTFAYVKSPWYASADVYYITPLTENCSMEYLLGILNSSLLYFWLFFRGKRKGEYLELYATPLKNLPIYYPAREEEMEEIIRWVREIQQGEREEEAMKGLQAKIDQAIFRLYGLTKGEEEEIKAFVRQRRQSRS